MQNGEGLGLSLDCIFSMTNSKLNRTMKLMDHVRANGEVPNHSIHTRDPVKPGGFSLAGRPLQQPEGQMQIPAPAELNANSPLSPAE